MLIPKKFKLGGITWTVHELPSIPNAMGACNHQEASIVLLKGLTQEIKEQTFLHELNHAIMFSMGIPQPEHDEKFVDGFATLLHQYLKQIK